jgi:hypothetical protein
MRKVNNRGIKDKKLPYFHCFLDNIVSFLTMDACEIVKPECRATSRMAAYAI